MSDFLYSQQNTSESGQQPIQNPSVVLGGQGDRFIMAFGPQPAVFDTLTGRVWLMVSRSNDNVVFEPVLFSVVGGLDYSLSPLDDITTSVGFSTSLNKLDSLYTDINEKVRALLIERNFGKVDRRLQLISRALLKNVNFVGSRMEDVIKLLGNPSQYVPNPNGGRTALYSGIGSLSLDKDDLVLLISVDG